jgi:hypothetical protein
MTHKTAIAQGLEPIYPEHTENGKRIFYDTKEGKYYDASIDMYFEVQSNAQLYDMFAPTYK